MLCFTICRLFTIALHKLKSEIHEVESENARLELSLEIAAWILFV